MEDTTPKHSSLTGTIVILAAVGIAAVALVLWPLLHKSKNPPPVSYVVVTPKDDEPSVKPLPVLSDAPAPPETKTANSAIQGAAGTPPPQVQVPKRIHLEGSSTQHEAPVYQPKPEYPELAKAAHVQGTVRVDVVIGRDGTVQGVKLISGHPLLVTAAINAVRRWRYRSMLVHGKPVEVETEVDVNFTLTP